MPAGLEGAHWVAVRAVRAHPGDLTGLSTRADPASPSSSPALPPPRPPRPTPHPQPRPRWSRSARRRWAGTGRWWTLQGCPSPRATCWGGTTCCTLASPSAPTSAPMRWSRWGGRWTCLVRARAARAHCAPTHERAVGPRGRPSNFFPCTPRLLTLSSPRAPARVAAEKKGADGSLPDIIPVFVTLDPHRDSCAQVGTYVKDFHPRMVGECVGWGRGGDGRAAGPRISPSLAAGCDRVRTGVGRSRVGDGAGARVDGVCGARRA